MGAGCAPVHIEGGRLSYCTMIVIPMRDLSAQALQGVIDAFILREGTDYGHRDISLQEKRDRVRQLLESGQAEIQYFPDSEFIDIQMC